jgi:hypothetical protein
MRSRVRAGSNEPCHLTRHPFTEAAMPGFVDITGQRFGRLIVLSLAGQAKDGRFRWLCQCDCGARTVVRGPKLRSKRTRSCGCLKLDRDAAKNPHFKHGLSHSPEHRCWVAMIQRCQNQNAKSYKDYGGRGIKVCKRWHHFETFLSDMGRRPPGRYSIERIDNERGYTPSNCKWIPLRDQAKNRRTTRHSRPKPEHP